MPFPRMTIQRMMLVVVLMALVLGSFVEVQRWRQRRKDYLQKAAYHAREYRTSYQMKMANPDSTFWQKNEAYHSALRLKYERAASRPWEIAPPDGPDPTFLGY